MKQEPLYRRLNAFMSQIPEYIKEHNRRKPKLPLKKEVQRLNVEIDRLVQGMSKLAVICFGSIPAMLGIVEKNASEDSDLSTIQEIREYFDKNEINFGKIFICANDPDDE